MGLVRRQGCWSWKTKDWLISQKEEQEDPIEDSEELEETREVNHELKTQLEEAKRIEEILKN